MIPPTGPTRFALFLLCCTGAWLAAHMAPTGGARCQTIVRELKGLYEQVLKVQGDEAGLPTSPYPLPPLTHGCQPHRINGSAILPYAKAIKPYVHGSTVIEEVMQQLGKIKALCEPSTEVPEPAVPSHSFQRKWFISAVLRELALCLKSL